MADPSPTPPVVREIARLLAEKGVTQYALRQAGMGSATAKNLLAGEGNFHADQLEIALGLIQRTLWHRRSDKGTK